MAGWVAAHSLHVCLGVVAWLGLPHTPPAPCQPICLTCPALPLPLCHAACCYVQHIVSCHTPALPACSSGSLRRHHLRRFQQLGAGQPLLAAAARQAGTQPHRRMLPAGGRPRRAGALDAALLLRGNELHLAAQRVPCKTFTPPALPSTLLRLLLRAWRPLLQHAIPLCIK